MTTVDQLEAFFRARSVLVVGGEGFLAQNAIRRLVGLGARVTSLVREQRRPLLAGVQRLIVGDMREAAVAQDAIRDQEVVLNFAGVTSAVTSNRMPSVSLLEECLPHLSLLGACAEQASKPLIVFPSSRLVYGKPQYLPVDEGHQTHPTTVYGIHKLTVEHYLRVYRATAGLPFLILRISNPYGPHQLQQRGYGILNAFVQQALAGEPIRLFGDGSQRRDFIFVDDLVEIMLHAIATPACHNEIYNVGGAEPVRLADAAGIIADEVAGTSIVHEAWPAEHLKVETGDYVGKLGKLSTMLPHLPFTPLREGVAATVKAYRNAGPPAPEHRTARAGAKGKTERGEFVDGDVDDDQPLSPAAAIF